MRRAHLPSDVQTRARSCNWPLSGLGLRGTFPLGALFNMPSLGHAPDLPAQALGAGGEAESVGPVLQAVPAHAQGGEADLQQSFERHCLRCACARPCAPGGGRGVRECMRHAGPDEVRMGGRQGWGEGELCAAFRQQIY